MSKLTYASLHGSNDFVPRINPLSDSYHNDEIDISISRVVGLSGYPSGLMSLPAEGRWFGSSFQAGNHGLSTRLARSALAWLLVTSALCPTSSALAQASSAQYCYDAAGRLIGLIDANGSAIYTYDAVGNTLSVTHQAASVLVVVGASPPSAAVGATITIYGTGFGTVGNTGVKFNGTSATPSAVTSTTITVTVPSGATTGPLTVTSPTSPGTATAPANFTVTKASAPGGLAFSPTQATPWQTTLTVTGTHINPQASQDKLFVNGRAVAIASATSTSVTAVVPNVGAGLVTLETPYGTATASGGSLEVLPDLCTTGLQGPPCYPTVTSWQTVALPPAGQSANVTLTATAPNDAIVQFAGTAGQRIYAFAPPGDPAFSNVLIFGADGSQLGPLLGLDAGGTGGVGPTTLPATGTYTLLYQPYPSITGTRALQLYVVPPDIAGTLTAGGAGATSVTLTSTTAGQQFDLSYAAPPGSGGGYLLDAQWNTALGSGDTQPLIRTVAPDVASNFTVQSVGPNWATAFLPSATLESGNYTSTFMPPAGYPSSTGSSGLGTFTLFEVPAPLGGAVTLPSSGSSITINGTTTVPGQSITGTFTTSSNIVVSLVSQSAMNQIDGRGASDYAVEANDLSTQTAVTGFPERVTAGLYPYVFSGPVALMPGTYAVGLTPSYPYGTPLVESAYGSASVILWNVPASATATLSATTQTTQNPVVVAPGQTVAASLVDSASGTRVVALDFVPTMSQSPSGTPSYNVNLSYPAGSTCGTGTVFDQSGADASLYSNNITLPCSGTYALSITPNSTTVGTFSTTSYPVTTVSQTTTTLGTTTLTNSTLAGSYDLVYKPSATNTITISAADPFTSGALLQLSVNGTLTAQTSGTGTLQFNNVIVSSGNTYSVEVQPLAPVSGSATIALAQSSPGVTPVITADASTSTFPIPESGQPIIIAFMEKAGHRISLLTEPNASLTAPGQCYDVTLTAPGGTTLYDSGATCDESTFSGPVPQLGMLDTGLPSLPTDGIYNVRLTPLGNAMGSARFTLYDVPPDPLVVTTPGDAAVQLTTVTPGQSAHVAFVGQAGQTPKIRVGVQRRSGGDACEAVTLRAPDTSIVRSDLNCKEQYGSGPVRLPTDGTYTVIVASTGTDVETVNIAVNK